jgi:hypothetical protein
LAEGKLIYMTKKQIISFVVVIILVVIGYLVFKKNAPKVSLTTSNAATSPSTEPLLQQSDLTYIGSFRVPAFTPSEHGATYGLDFSATGIAYNPQNNSLFMNNHAYEVKTTEISIPTPKTDLSSLNRATLLQDFGDVTEGMRQKITADGSDIGNGARLGGFLVWGNKLIGTDYGWYDAGYQAVVSHFTSSLNMTQTGDFSGFYKVGTLDPSFYGGYMAEIPPEWQSILGGKALTGNCCLSIIGRTSFGPAAFAFDPDDLGVKNPVPAQPMVYYDGAHQTLGQWLNDSEQNIYFNMGTGVNGIAFPQGSRSVLFFGRQGIGIPCYGEGGAVEPPDAHHWCYDPQVSSKGNHAYPYKYWVWAYDANEFAQVKAGAKNPWDVRPYAVWSLDKLSEINPDLIELGINGVAYDPVKQYLYIAQTGAESILPGSSPYAYAPLFTVWKVNLTGGGYTNPPTLPPITTPVAPNPTPAPTPAPVTSNCPRGASVTDSSGDVWTLGTSGETLRNGTHMAGGLGTVYLVSNKILYVQGTIGGWYKWNGTSWPYYSAGEPACVPVVGDLNSDGIVNSLDWSYMNSKWFTADTKADLNHDGIVNSIDFSILNNNWQKS